MNIEIITTASGGQYNKVTAESGYILTYKDKDFSFAGMLSRTITTSEGEENIVEVKKQSMGVSLDKTIESFEDIQSLVDRVIELELIFDVQDIISAIDAGAVIPEQFMEWARANATEDELTELN